MQGRVSSFLSLQFDGFVVDGDGDGQPRVVHAAAPPVAGLGVDVLHAPVHGVRGVALVLALAQAAVILESVDRNRNVSI